MTLNLMEQVFKIKFSVVRNQVLMQLNAWYCTLNTD